MTTKRRARILAIAAFVGLWAFIIWANWDSLMTNFEWK